MVDLEFESHLVQKHFYTELNRSVDTFMSFSYSQKEAVC